MTNPRLGTYITTMDIVGARDGSGENVVVPANTIVQADHSWGSQVLIGISSDEYVWIPSYVWLRRDDDKHTSKTVTTLQRISPLEALARQGE